MRENIQIEEILEEIDEINHFLEIGNCHNLSTFLSNNLLKKAVMMSIINIGEQTKYLSKSFLAKNKDINFNQYREIRNIAAHKYGTINFVLIWNIVKKTFPKFEQQLLHIKKPEKAKCTNK